MPASDDGLLLVGRQARQAEVGELDVAVGRQDHVLGLDIAVDQAALVGVLQRQSPTARTIRSASASSSRALPFSSSSLIVVPSTILHDEVLHGR